MLLWNSLKIKDIMKAAVMVIVSLVVMQIMIIGEDIVSLVSSTEFWRGISWSMGLILVPLINSSKQKYIIKSYHDLQHGEIGDSGVSELAIGYTPFILDGWVTKYHVKMIESSNCNNDVYLLVAPRFNAKAYEHSRGTTSTQYSEILNTGMVGGPETIHEYTNFRPYITYFNQNDNANAIVKSATVDIMEWCDKGSYMAHHIVAGSPGSISQGGIDIYIEYTFVVANYNDTSRRNPKKSNTFMTIAWNGTTADQRSIIMNSGLRLIGMEVFATNLVNNETIVIGKNLSNHSNFASSTESVNDFNTTPTDNEMIIIEGTAVDTSPVDTPTGDSINYYHKHPMYFHKGEVLSLATYNDYSGFNLWITAQVMFNYQDQHTIEFEETMLNPTGTTTRFIRIPTDLYIESIELELLCEEQDLQVREGQFDIFGIKDNDFFEDTNAGTHFSTSAYQGLRLSNVLDKMKFTANGDSKAAIYQSYCSPMDYYPQGSTIAMLIEVDVFDKVEYTILIKARNATKSNNRNALQFWRDDVTSLKLGGGQ